METVYLSADVGGTTIKLAIIEDDGTIKKKWEIPTNRDNKGASIPEDIHQAFEAAIEELHINREQIAGIGAGAPGFVDTDTGYIHEAVNIGWKDFPFGEILRERTGFPVWVDNDANLAALGENWLGAGNGAANLIAITLGTGVGGGVIVNGGIINGANGTAAEIGHVTVVPDGGAPCNCGKTGCLETETSATGIVRKAKKAIEENQNTSLLNLAESGNLTTKDVFDASASGDQVATAVLEEVIDTLGMAIANLAIVINPEKIVIGGGVSKAGDQLLEPLKKTYEKYALGRTAEASTFGIAKLGNDAGVIGGAYLVKSHM